MTAVPVPKVAPIFAVPFATATVPEAAALNAELVPLLAARAVPNLRGGGPGVPDPAVFESREDLLRWPEPAVQRLRAHLLESVTTLAADLNGLDADDLPHLRLQARAWFTRVQPQGGLPARSHRMASWCAIYCVQAGEQVAERLDGGALRLYDPRLGNLYLDPGNSRLRRPYGHGHLVARCIEGQLVLFPAHLLHEIAPLQGTRDLLLVTAVCRFVLADAAR